MIALYIQQIKFVAALIGMACITIMFCDENWQRRHSIIPYIIVFSVWSVYLDVFFQTTIFDLFEYLSYAKDYGFPDQKSPVKAGTPVEYIRKLKL